MDLIARVMADIDWGVYDLPITVVVLAALVLFWATEPPRFRPTSRADAIRTVRYLDAEERQVPLDEYPGVVRKR